MNTNHDKPQFLFSYNDFNVFDFEHAVKNWVTGFTSLEKELLFESVKQGLNKITEIGNFLLVSKNKNFRIPIEIRIDSDNKNKKTVVILPALRQVDIQNSRNELEALIDNTNLYDRSQIIEGFNFYLQHGKIFTDFDEIEVE